MDPAACLADAESFVLDLEFEEAAYALSHYFRWRMEGGFEPANGDYRATIVLARIGKNADKYRSAWQANSEMV